MTSEHHLGDSLAALIDGELSHDHRERVLAHLVTCGGCRAEAEAQRALKNAFARSPLPAPSAGLLARLQGLPGGAPEPPPPGGGGDWRLLEGVLPRPARRREAPLSVPLLGDDGGFPVHRPGERPGRTPVIPLAGPGSGLLAGGRSPRGHRFAFAAAGAFSLAAFAIGGALAAAGPGGQSGGGTVAMVATGGSPTASAARTTSASREDARAEQETLDATVGLNSEDTHVSYLGHSVSADMAALLAARQDSLGEELLPLAVAPVRATVRETSAEPTRQALDASAADLDTYGAMSPR